MFDRDDFRVAGGENVGEFETQEARSSVPCQLKASELITMETHGPCKDCSCPGFTRKPNAEQFCGRCGHARSRHVH